MEKNPESPIILNNYAYHLSIQGIRLPEALEYVKKALQADPENSPYLDTLGWIYYQLGDYTNAKIYIEKSLSFQSDIPEVIEHLGDVCEKLEEYNLAEEYWRKAYDLDKSREHLLKKIGQTTP